MQIRWQKYRGTLVPDLVSTLSRTNWHAPDACITC